MFETLRAIFTPHSLFSQPGEPEIVRPDSIVMAYHPRSRAIGELILEAGGNAFDAFVAVAVAENVLSEGASSLAGPLGALCLHAATGEISFLDADFNGPLDPEDHGTALIPGAPAGLEALLARYGSMPLARLLAPSIQLAAEGVPVNRLLSTFISARASILKNTPYGRETFFRKGKPLKAGDLFTQPRVAEFLASFAELGAAHVYAGDWSRQFLESVHSQGSSLSEADFATYQTEWRVPLRADYRGYQVYSGSGRSYGGPWCLMALKTLECGGEPPASHYSQDADGLERMVRIARQIWSEPWLLDYRELDQPESIMARFAPEYAGRIWSRVVNRDPDDPIQLPGSHSYQIGVADRWGNVVNGTTTIQSEPWGDGQFVQGLPITTGGSIPWSTVPGGRRLTPMSIHLAIKDGKPDFSVGAFSNSLPEAAFQFLSNRIDYHMPAIEAVTSPRFGTFPTSSLRQNFDRSRNWLDPRIDKGIVSELKKRGLRFKRRGIIDTGLGVFIAFEPDNSIHGAAVPIPYVPAPWDEAV